MRGTSGAFGILVGLSIPTCSFAHGAPQSPIVTLNVEVVMQEATVKQIQQKNEQKMDVEWPELPGSIQNALVKYQRAKKYGKKKYASFWNGGTAVTSPLF